MRITGQGDPDISHPPPKTEQSQQQTPVVSAQPVSSEPVTSKPLKVSRLCPSDELQQNIPSQPLLTLSCWSFQYCNFFL